MSKVKHTQFEYVERSEKQLRDALGVLVGSPFGQYPNEADVVADAISEALTLRRRVKRCPKCCGGGK